MTISDLARTPGAAGWVDARAVTKSPDGTLRVDPEAAVQNQWDDSHAVRVETQAGGGHLAVVGHMGPFVPAEATPGDDALPIDYIEP